VLTKVDKLSKSRRQQQRRTAADALAAAPEDLVLFSAKTRQGRTELWSLLLALTGAEGGRP
jgi:GTP-binding protein EngB required for normal cell division